MQCAPSQRRRSPRKILLQPGASIADAHWRSHLAYAWLNGRSTTRPLREGRSRLAATAHRRGNEGKRPHGRQALGSRQGLRPAPIRQPGVGARAAPIRFRFAVPDKKQGSHSLRIPAPVAGASHSLGRGRLKFGRRTSIRPRRPGKDFATRPPLAHGASIQMGQVNRHEGMESCDEKDRSDH